MKKPSDKKCIDCGAGFYKDKERCGACKRKYLADLKKQEKETDEYKAEQLRLKLIKDEQKREKRRQYYHDNLEARKAYQSAIPDTKRKDYRLKHNYGINLREYEDMLKLRNFECDICKAKHSDGKPLRVDHCHTTGIIRGLLCTQCNFGLGHFRDDTNLLAKATEYLNKPKE